MPLASHYFAFSMPHSLEALCKAQLTPLRTSSRAQVFHDHLSAINLSGMGLCLLGANLYACVKLRRTRNGALGSFVRRPAY